MTPEQLESLAQLLEAIDRRLSAIDQRFVRIEHDIADSASYAEEHAKELHAARADGAKLVELYTSLNASVDDFKSIMGNYVDDTKGLRQQTRELISAVRARSG